VRAIAVLAPLFAACDEAPAPAPAVQRFACELREASDVPAGSIRGRVEFRGTPPARISLEMGTSDACSGGSALSESLVVANGRVAGVLVRISRGLSPTVKWPAPSEPVVLDQRGCVFAPHVVAVRVGQPLRVHNDDATVHNVRAKSVRTEAANVNAHHFPGGPDLEFVYTEPETAMSVQCDYHPWMQAWVHAVDHPFFAVTGGDGSFELRGLAPGRYEIECVHETLGKRSFELQLGAERGLEAVVTASTSP
jgi:plastocyanin